MKPAPFDLVVAQSVDEALEALAEAGDEARVMAGGQSLMPMLNMRLTRPSIVVDIARIADLDHIRAPNGAAGEIEIGATTTQRAVLAWPDLGAKQPLLAAAMPYIGHVQTRNRGTVCGSLCHADPSSELPLCLATLGGKVVLKSRGRERVVAAGDFQAGLLSTAKEPDELMIATRFPAAKAGQGHAFREIARRHGDFAIVALAAVAWDDKVRVGVGGMADKPVVREWQGLDNGSALDDALNALAWELGGVDDIHATARYRRDMVRRLGRDVIEEARACRG